MTSRRSRWPGRATRGPTRYGATRDELAELLAGEPRYRVDQVWEGLYRGLARPTR